MATELLKTYEAEISRLTLIPSDGGKFEVLVNRQLIFSKKQTGRHANPGEISNLLRKYLQENKR